MTFPSPALLLLSLLLVCATPKDAFTTLVTHEIKQRQMAGLTSDQYHLLPLRLNGDQQHFLQTPTSDEILYVEVVVHWISPNSSLNFPSFDLNQKVKIIIEEQSFASTPSKSVLKKEFLTQTGFKVNITAGKKYRWRVSSSGEEQKMVEIAVARRPLTDLQLSNPTFHIQHNETEFLREMSSQLEHIKSLRSKGESERQEANVPSMWAWMSGFEMVSLLAVVLVQLTLFEKFMLPSSVV